MKISDPKVKAEAPTAVDPVTVADSSATIGTLLRDTGDTSPTTSADPPYRTISDHELTLVLICADFVCACTEIDEIPQFINVFKGDMSVVGPRPFVPSESHVEGWATRRFDCVLASRDCGRSRAATT